MMELANGVLPDGTRYISEENLRARREPQVQIGENRSYGMGLYIEQQGGVTVIHHDGSMIGYKSAMFFLPDAGVGAVILTNADEGEILLTPFLRRLLEVLYDARPQAADDLASAAERHNAEQAKERERLRIPADPAATARLKPRYHNAALGDLVVKKQGAKVIFDLGEWTVTVGTRANDDGTISFVAIDPGMDFEFVAGEGTLTIRDRQHEYVFTAGAP
jgi:hypothetical protein